MTTIVNQSSDETQNECTCIQIDDNINQDQQQKTAATYVLDKGDKMQGEILNPKDMIKTNKSKHQLTSTSTPDNNSEEVKSFYNDLRTDNKDRYHENDKECVYTITNGLGGHGNESNGVRSVRNSVKLKKLPNSKRKQIKVMDPVKEGFFKSFFYSQIGPNNIKLLIAEFVGTGLLLFLGCMGCLGSHTQVPGFMASFSFGLTVMIIIQMFGHISGAHLNPAVTMVTALSGIIEMKSAPFYILGQFAGAICGLGGLKMLLPSTFTAQDFIDEVTNATIHKQGLCTTNLNPALTAAQGFGIEVVITFILIFICYAIWDKRNAAKQDSVPIRFGFVIAAIGIAAGPLSGGSMNTARSFAPALLNNDWENQWVYWLGPTLGGLIAHYFYKYIYAVNADEPEEEEYEEELKTMNKV